MELPVETTRVLTTRPWATALLGIVAWLLPAIVGAQAGPPPAQPPGITQTQADAILNELKQIRQLLEKSQTPPRVPAAPQPTAVKLRLNGAPSLGRDDAPLTLVEFTDYQCPFCRQFHSTTFDQLKRAFIDTGQVRFISRDLPLDIHIYAVKAAQAARCAGEQGRFWDMRDVLSRNASNLTADAILTYAADTRLDLTLFRPCVSGDRYVAEIKQDITEAAAIGISGTPSFVLGRTAADVLDGMLIVGAQPFTTFEASIKQLQSKTR